MVDFSELLHCLLQDPRNAFSSWSVLLGLARIDVGVEMSETHHLALRLLTWSFFAHDPKVILNGLSMMFCGVPCDVDAVALLCECESNRSVSPAMYVPQCCIKWLIIKADIVYASRMDVRRPRGAKSVPGLSPQSSILRSSSWKVARSMKVISTLSIGLIFRSFSTALGAT